MERMKRWLSLALALVLVLSYVPANVFAAEGGEDPAPQETTAPVETTAPADTEAEETVADAEDMLLAEEMVTISAQVDPGLPENEELFAAYAEGVFYGMGGVSMFATGTRTAGAALTGDEKVAYDALVPIIKQIAAGERSSAVIALGQDVTVNVNGVPTLWPVDTAATFTGTRDTFDLQIVIDALMTDYPYEMYWYDKVGGIQLMTNNGTIRYARFSMSVAKSYGGNYAVDTAKTGAAVSAANKAASIVAKYAAADDYGKLIGFRNEICTLVSYDRTAANGDAYYYTNTNSNPWQLIYVFDGDSATNVVCEGYAKAFQYLCDMAGIDCICATGYMDNGTDSEGHMWNIVTLKGKNYLVDVTNSDTGKVGMYGGLFLAGAPGSVASGYSFRVDQQTVSYTYSTESLSLWSNSELSLAAASYSANVTVCFVPNTGWKDAGAWFAAYYWDGNGSDGFVKLEADGFCYTGQIPGGHNNIIFLRMDPAKTALDFASAWNQTNDLTMDASKPCLIKDNGWTGTGGTWTTCPPAYDYYLAGYLNNANVGIEGVANKAANKFVDGKVTVTLTADSYVCLGVQYGTSVIGNYMTKTYVASGNTATLYPATGDKLFVPKGTWQFTLTTNTDGSVTVSYGCPHNMTYHTAADATCGAPGNVAYYACSVCGKNFSDEAGTSELTKVTTDALSHEIQHVAAKEASCGVPGNLEHYYCDVCKGYFLDEAGENATTKEAVTLTKNHLNQQYLQKDATCTEDGYTFHYKCDYCGATFEDQDGTKPIDPTLTATGHSYDENGFCANVANGITCGAYEPASGSGTEADPYLIENAGQLFWFAAVVNDGYGDVAKNNSAWGKLTASIEIPDGHNWVPIGREVYYGSFDGGNFTVSNMQTSGDYPYVGMFGKVEGSELKNITVGASGFVTTNDVYGYAGGLVGYAYGQDKNVTITNCQVTFTTVIGDEAGGIVGRMDSFPEITNCSGSSNIITSSSDYGTAGGIAGTMRMGGSIASCNSGSNTIAGYYCGGIAGYVENQAGPYANRSNSVTGCSAYSTVGNADSEYTGGIVGYVGSVSELTINNCRTGNCTLTAAYNVNSRVGGLLGSCADHDSVSVKVSNSYTYNVTISGFNLAYLTCGQYVTVENCYSNVAEGANTPLTIGTSYISKVERKTDEQFASGEVCWLLNGEKADGAWGQSLGTASGIFPNQGDRKVYKVAIDCQGSVGYSNTESTGTPAHSYDENGFCINKADYVVCDAYQPAVKVTEDNYTELGLTDAYIGYYAIQNAGNLYWFADKVDNENVAYGYANAVLTADIRIPSKPTGTRYWKPIGSADAKYSGIFDGNGKAIGDIFAGDTTADMVGLVAWLTEDGVVKNVTVTGVRLNGNDTVGAIVAYNEGTVELCGNTASVIGEGISIGGIVGVNAGTVRNCWNTGRISGEDAGGIVGNNAPGAKLENCWYTGELEGTNAGGIVGFHQTGATAENCYTTQETAIATAEGTVSKVETKTADQFASGEVAYLLGGVWGQNIDNDQPAQTVPALNGATVYLVTADCQGNLGYSNTESTGTPAHNYVNGFCVNEANGVVCDAYEPAALVTEENYTELGLSADYIGYYAITNAGNLYWFAEKVDNENAAYKTAKVVLTADITVNTGTMDANTTGAREWNPIGYWGNSRDYAAFNGTFDGNNKKISGLYFSDTDSTAGKSVALIAETESGALVKNVTVTNTWFHGNGQVAGIVGDNGGTITGCVSEASLSCTWSYIGGMAGWNEGTITGCINRGTIAGKYNNSGGIAGHNAGTVELCGNEGNISDDWCFAGGIAGNNADTIRNCWNTGKVYVTNSIAGGIAGKNNPDDLLENCWSTGAVSCGSDPEAAGGIVGVSENATQRNCYSVMKPVGVIEDKGGVSTVENMDQITLDQLASGEVAYLLRTRAAAGTDVWGQNIDNDQTKQNVPALNGADVYYGYFNCHSTEAKYTNTAVSAEPVEHSYDNGFCTNELTDGTVCDAYEPAVLVTAENREELGLAESYIGYYAINNGGNLYWFADKVDNENATYGSVNVVLTADVTVNEGTVTASSTGMRDWNPIGWFSNTSDDRAAFSGTFDGNGKSISGLYFNNEDIDGVSLFAITGETALVKNVTVTNSYFCGYGNNSAVVAINLGTVSSCFNEATLSGYTQIGGIVGRNLGLVELCGNTGAITGDWSNVGGIVGENKSTVRNCWNTGNIQVGYNYVGGITGANDSVRTDDAAALTENCWSTGTVVNLNRSTAGGIVGAAWVNLGGVRNCYSLMKPVGAVWSGHPVTNVEQKTLDQFASGEVAYLLRTRAAEGTDVWGQNIDNDQTKQNVPALNGADVYQIAVDCAGTLGYSNTDASKAVHNYVNGFCVNENAEGGLCDAYEPAVLVTEDNYTELGLTADYVGYYAISNAGQLYWFADKVDNEHDTYGSVNVVLTDNITVNAGTVTAESTGMRAWTPIGDWDHQYGGTFDGNGKTVSGLYYNDNGNDNSAYVALISCMAESGVVKNVTVTNSAFVGYRFTAAIVGYNFGTVTGCINEASVSGSTYSAGIAANNRGTVELCGNTGTIHAWAVSGGIVARSMNNGPAQAAVVKNCWNTGSISSENKIAGGIVGESSALVSTYTFAEVRDCWSTGSVSAPEAVGGVTGDNWHAVVSNCYSVMAPVGVLEQEAYTDKAEQKTDAQFASGEVAYLLRTRAIGGTNVWGQDLDNGKEVQTVPTFTGAPVYYGYSSCAETEAKYTNANVSADPIEHDWEYTADGASITGECKNECGTDGGEVTLVLDGSAVYDGSEKTVKADGTLSGIDTLPAVTYEGDRINIGTFTAYLTLEDGTKAQLEVTVTAKSITPTVEGVEDSYTYTGKAIEPEITVKDGDKVLTEGTDYDVTYGENLNVGEGTVKVTLKGNYEGEAEQTFDIDPKAITPTVEGADDSYTYTGEAIKPTVTVKDGDKVLTDGMDYDVTYGENLNVGEGTVKVTLKGNYEGELEQTFDITAKAITPTVEGVEESYGYTGEAIKPTVTVKGDGKTLVEGIDYEVTYGGNTNVADGGSVKVTLKGNYEGELEQTFTITARTLTISGMTGTDKVYDGKTDAAVELKVDGIEATDDVEVSFQAAYESAKAGTQRIHVTGITLSGDDASNYVIASETTGSGEIAQATVTVIDVKVADKTYDGTTDAQVTEVLYSGIVSGEDATVTAAGSFDSAGSGENKTVNLTYALSGEGSENYVLAETTGTTTASIKPVDAEEVMKPLEDVTTDNVTSDDLPAIEETRKELEDALEDPGLTDEQKKEIEDALDELDELEQRVDDAQNAVIDESVNDTMDVTGENVTKDDREDLEKAKDVLEDALDNFGDNYTDEEKEIIQDELDRIEDALDVLDKVEAVEDMIEALPESVQPDDEETVAAIEEAKKAYDELTDHEKELVSDKAVEKLEGMLTALTYEIIKGNGLTWAKGTGARPEFTANGPYGKFAGLLVDGKEVAESNYEAKSGSTVITLKTAYIEGLTQGKHTITVLYTNGQADGYFYITVMADAPATGDSANVALWSGIALISLAAAAALVLGKKRLSV